MSFVFAAPIRFAHCDPAGIAYFPRLFELVDAAVEDWTAVTLAPRAEMHGPLRCGLPTVDLHASFTAPCRLGEHLVITVAHGRIGASSVELTATATVGGAPRFAVRLKQVLMNLDSACAEPWPVEWRARLA